MDAVPVPAGAEANPQGRVEVIRVAPLSSSWPNLESLKVITMVLMHYSMYLSTDRQDGNKALSNLIQWLRSINTTTHKTAFV